MTPDHGNKPVDELSGVETTGHEWDGIKELNNPLPRWWLWTFYGCIAIALIYSVLYPAWPLLTSATPGVLGYSSRADLEKEMSDVGAAQQATVQRIAALPLQEIAADPDLSRFATVSGASTFKVNCSQCHGTGAEGAAGYPNLNDDAWIWGGTLDDIYTTISHGARSPTDPDTRFNLMPNFGSDGILDPQAIQSVAGYVASLSGLEGGADTPEGRQLFADNCAACHGPTGKGMRENGAPDLSDQIWLYQGSLAAIEQQIGKPRHGVMPAWTGKLSDTRIKELAVYVHGLGGGQ
ncbi:cytochrome-c oxidase, cbb3-type subunit III [Devosia sp.]|uniref:cytochrome-c oxidase, cbb3-type subunit III n=1 Tax=Devosia sp. TaxID=1871048 RepID=UPI003264C9C2